MINLLHPKFSKKEIQFKNRLFPVIVLPVILIYGLLVHPMIFGGDGLPLEVIFLTATVISVLQLFYLGYNWEEIQNGLIAKIAKGMPAIFMLFSIGLVIGSWTICGTVPMMIYWGIEIINPKYIYIVAFIIPVIFSTCTGTSWGSAGTIGVVIIAIAQVVNANLAITAGAIVGGAYFGDKMSPLSNTTNIAAMVAEVPLFSHIRSLINTALPATIMAVIVYFVLGFIYTPKIGANDFSAISKTVYALKECYNFNLFLLLPIVIVLYGSITKKPVVPVLLTSSAVAAILALIFQKFSFTDVIIALNKGVNIHMITWYSDIPQNLVVALQRGGLYALIDAIIICGTAFLYIGSLDIIDALPQVVNTIFKSVKTRRATILTCLASTAMTNALTSNQFATSFVIAGAFNSKFDAMRIPRKVLSRCLEDTGTMLESLLPWTTTGIFMTATLGVSTKLYWHWQFLSLFTFVVAAFLAITGIGCFYHEVDGVKKKETEVKNN